MKERNKETVSGGMAESLNKVSVHKIVYCTKKGNDHRLLQYSMVRYRYAKDAFANSKKRYTI